MSENALCPANHSAETIGDIPYMRDENGKFRKGTAPGPGRKANRTEPWKVVRSHCTPERVREVFDGLFRRARRGDAQAAKIWLSYALGLPRQAPPEEPVELGRVVDSGDAFTVIAKVRDLLADGVIDAKEAREFAALTSDLERRARRLVSGAEG